jgi:sugar phosphate permease
MSTKQSAHDSIGDGLAFRLYDFATGDEDARLCRDIPDDQCQEQPRSFLFQVLAQAFSKIGDVLSDSKVVLPWLLGAIGAPVFLIGFLVPIRESLALLPQVIIGDVIRRFSVRKGFWIAGSVIEGTCVILMGVVAALGLRGAAGGWTIIGLLVVFSLARGVASIAAKDTLGKTVSKGRRGRVSGYAATVSGAVAVAVGLYLALSPEKDRPGELLYWLIVAAGISWFLAAAIFSMINERPGATAGGRSIRGLAREQLKLLITDRELQKFLSARALLVSTALVGPVYVSLAQRETGQNLDGLGWLILASGLAGTLSSSFWGAFSDKSSRLTLACAAMLAGALGVAVVAALNFVPGLTDNIAFFAIILFVLGIAHSGVRIGRKTHVVDLASGDRKGEYVALSNSIIGVWLLLMGGLSGLFLGFGLESGIVALSVLTLCGAFVALGMSHMQA